MVEITPEPVSTYKQNDGMTFVYVLKVCNEILEMTVLFITHQNEFIRSKQMTVEMAGNSSVTKQTLLLESKLSGLRVSPVYSVYITSNHLITICPNLMRTRVIVDRDTRG